MSLLDNHKPGEYKNGDNQNGANSNKYDLKYAVQLPCNEDPNEWIAKYVFDFHKQISMLYGTLNEFCTPTSCPRMTAGKRFEYQWADSTTREPIRFTARQYIHHLLDWVQEQLDDEDVFPSVDKKFPQNHIDTCRMITKRLVRVYAHIYHHHLDKVKSLDEHGHMNTSLKHFIYFVQEYDLVTGTDLDPLIEFIQKLT